SANNDAIEAFAETVLSRDGTSPNEMYANIDMNSNRIINLATPTNNSDAATKFYVDDRTGNAPDHAAAAAQSALEAAQSASAANVAKEDAELAKQAAEAAQVGAEAAQAAAEQAKEDTEQLLSSITFPIAIEDGGTGATDAAGARSNLGLGSLATKSTVATSDIDNDAVTLSKMAHGTQGDILYYGASGAPTRLAAGAAGQVLKTNGAGADPSWTDSFSQLYESPEQSITLGSTITVSHGLGGVPRSVMVTIRCKTANNDFSVG